MALAEREIAAGRHAEWPMTLAALPHLADPSRIDDAGRRPLWTYAHVPADSTADLIETITAFERFAPGFRDLVLAARCVPAAQMSAHNANYVGGDIIVGGATLFGAWSGRRCGSTLDHTHPEGIPVSSATPPGDRRARHGRLLRRAHGAAARVRNHPGRPAWHYDELGTSHSSALVIQFRRRQGVCAASLGGELLPGPAGGGIYRVIPGPVFSGGNTTQTPRRGLPISPTCACSAGGAWQEPLARFQSPPDQGAAESHLVCELLGVGHLPRCIPFSC